MRETSFFFGFSYLLCKQYSNYKSQKMSLIIGSVTIHPVKILVFNNHYH